MSGFDVCMMEVICVLLHLILEMGVPLMNFFLTPCGFVTMSPGQLGHSLDSMDDDELEDG